MNPPQNTPYNPPKTTSTLVENPDSPLPELSLKQLTHLITLSLALKVISAILVISYLATALSFTISVSDQPFDSLILGHLITMYLIHLVLFGFPIAAALIRNRWTQIAAIISFALMLPAPYFLTILGIFGITLFILAQKLFGKNKITHKHLVQEYLHRKNRTCSTAPTNNQF